MSLASWMFKQRLPASYRTMSGTDMLCILASFVFIQYVYLHTFNFTTERSFMLFSVLGFAYFTFAGVGLYRPSTSHFLHQLLVRLTLAWFIVGLLVALALYLSKMAEEVSRVWFVSSMILSYVLLVGIRLASGIFLAISHTRGKRVQPVVLVGHSRQCKQVIQRIKDNPWTGYRISKSFICAETLDMDDVAIESMLQDVHMRIENHRQSGKAVAEVWVCLPLSYQPLIEKIISRLGDSAVDVCLLPDTFGIQFFSGTATNVAELPVVNISDIRLPGSADLFKRIFDRVVSLASLLLLWPVFLVISIAIKLDSRGPVLFRQTRYGVDGKEIEVWKFRSMSVQENGRKVRQATRNDPRVTRVGAFLRQHSLDELPQFFNVLQGRMSIVGPRPHAVSHNEEYRSRITGYMLRHKIKPGITGWAQVNGWRGETDTLEKMEKRVRFDLEYIQNWSPWLDVKIMLMTILQGFSSKDVY